MENKFVEVNYDKFKNKTVSTIKSSLLIYDSDVAWDRRFRLEFRHVSTPETEALLLDVGTGGDDWYFLKDGNVIININDVENIQLEPHELSSNVYHGKCLEDCCYEIDQTILKKICDADNLDIQFNGKGYAYSYKGIGEFDGLGKMSIILYAKIAYNGFYDNKAYEDIIQELENHRQKKEEEERKSNSSSCLITLLMTLGTISAFFAAIGVIVNAFLV